MKGVEGFLDPKEEGLILMEQAAHLRGVGRGAEMGVGRLRVKEAAVDRLVRPIGGREEWESGVDIKFDVRGIDKNAIIIRDEEGGGVGTSGHRRVPEPFAGEDEVIWVDGVVKLRGRGMESWFFILKCDLRGEGHQVLVMDDEIALFGGASVLALVLGFGRRPIVGGRRRRSDGSVRGDTHVSELCEDLVVLRRDGGGGVVPSLIRDLRVPRVNGALWLKLLTELTVVVVNK